jgi:hypothetical protein
MGMGESRRLSFFWREEKSPPEKNGKLLFGPVEGLSKTDRARVAGI